VVEAICGVLLGIALLYVVILVALWLYARKNPELTFKTTLLILPNLMALFFRLLADSALPKSVRVWMALLIAYLSLPIDLVPDFLPLIGYADDAIIIALVLRHVVRKAGPEALSKHWRGSDAGLTIVGKLAGI
jgi:uncharacterized membrane protein YkvA (DUF1232 family)